jgi:serine/threonine-protein kinase mTOR
MELAARTLVKLGQLPGSKGVESFEYDIKQAFEFISDERNEVSYILLRIKIF